MTTVHAPVDPTSAPDMLAVLQSRVLEALNKENPGYAADPLDAGTWLGLFTSIVDTLLDCLKTRNAAAVLQSIQNPNTVQQVKLHREMIKQVGRQKLKQHGDRVHALILAVGKRASPQELQALLDQVQRA